jgi:hypothetical protein
MVRRQIKWAAVALVVMRATVGQNQISDEALDRAKQLTVMINATIDGDTRPGAGVVFGLANGEIYMATANHLVRRGLSRASEIEVEFQWLPGQPVPAQLLTYYDDRALDLAVVAVDLSKARVPPGGLSLDRLGDPGALTRGAALSAIGYPNGSAFDVSAAELSQIEAVSLKYRVPGLVPGGYSGGPLVDRKGMIVGVIRQDQPPDGEATRIDLVVSQLKAWNYEVRLQAPGANPAASNQPANTTENLFKDILLRYVAEAPSGFRALGAKPIGNWSPPVKLPDAVSCRGGGTAQEPFIECVLYRSDSEVEAADKFEDLIDIVRGVLPNWSFSRLNFFRAFFRNDQAAGGPTVIVDLGVDRRGDNYDNVLSVRRIQP